MIMNDKHRKGVFCISLDFELHWGVFEKIKVGDNANLYFKNTRYAIPKTLDLFSQNGIQATWAIVGMLYNRNFEEWKANIPTTIPDYSDKRVSSYELANQVSLEENSHLYFAPNLVELIQSTPGMEIGTHTYSHYYCQEQGQTPKQFRADLEKARELASAKGITIESLVFPRNQFNADYMDVCREMGIKSVRTNPDKWYWDTSKKDTLAVKIMRTGDVWFPVNNKSVVSLHEINTTNDPMQLPASRLYRSWTNNRLLNALKMKRIFSEMTKAAKTGGCYHLWWHPHNHGYHPNECLIELAEIADHFKALQKKYGLLSLNMQSLRNHLIQTHGAVQS